MRLAIISIAFMVFIVSCYNLDSSYDPESNSYRDANTSSTTIFDISATTIQSTVTTVRPGIDSVGTIFSGLDIYYEAENAILWGGAKISTYSSPLPLEGSQGVSNGEYVSGFQNSTTATILWKLNIDAGNGSYRVLVRYAAGDQTNDVTNTELWVNGTMQKIMYLQKTPNWNTWSIDTETLSLNNGLNTIEIRSSQNHASNPCANFDYIQIQANN